MSSRMDRYQAGVNAAHILFILILLAGLVLDLVGLDQAYSSILLGAAVVAAIIGVVSAFLFYWTDRAEPVGAAEFEPKDK